MPELPEMEIVARRIAAALAGAEVSSALAPGVATLKSFDPPPAALEGARLRQARRRGKVLVLDFGKTALLAHLMSAGRMGLLAEPGSIKDRSLRFALRFSDGRELRLREFGTKHRAWVKLLPATEVDGDETLAALGPEAWPAPPAGEFTRLISQPRHLHPLLRDQRTIAGIGRSWVDEILWQAELSPFRQGAELEPAEVERLRLACGRVLGAAVDHYERTVEGMLPDRAPKPLQVHGRQGEPCPRCGERLEAVFFSEHVTTYCPAEQTGGRVLKDRRLSRLLK